MSLHNNLLKTATQTLGELALFSGTVRKVSRSPNCLRWLCRLALKVLTLNSFSSL